MTAQLKIDFVSDVSCPWCAIGLSALEQALAKLGTEVKADLHFQPFELNPNMPPGGQDVTEHLTQKYGSTPEQQTQIRENIRLRGEELGFTFRKEGRGRIYNTFDAHRLLHWAEAQGEGKQHALKKALLEAYFTHGQAPESHEVLVKVAEDVGLDAGRAAAILASEEYTAEVRAQAQFYLQAGIQSVPAVIINDKHLISGGQPVEVFEQALRQIAAGQA
jgi:predicted DsbA family dithiol-disulfide isomerase